METHTTAADARYPARPRSADAPIISKSTQVRPHVRSKSWAGYYLPREALSETMEHTADPCNSHSNSHGGAGGHCATHPRAKVDAVVDATGPFECDFLTAASSLCSGTDSFESISYQGQESCLENPLIMDLLCAIKWMSNEIQNYEPGIILEGLPRVKLIPARKGRKAFAPAAKPMMEHSNDHNESNQLPDTKAIRRDERKEAPEAERLPKKHQTDGLGSPFRTPSPAQTSATEISPNTPKLCTSLVSIGSFAHFWERHGQGAIRVDYGLDAYTGDEIMDVVNHILKLQELRPGNPCFTRRHHELKARMPKTVTVTYWNCADRNMSENEVDTHRREGTAYPKSENSDSNKENWSGPVRSKRRRLETQGSGQCDKRRKRPKKGGSLEDAIDLTRDC